MRDEKRMRGDLPPVFTSVDPLAVGERSLGEDGSLIVTAVDFDTWLDAKQLCLSEATDSSPYHDRF